VRIAQVSPLYESVPPLLYGGTERVVSHLVEELVQQGHHVTLFASGDSQTAANLVPVCERALRLDTKCHDSLAHHIIMLDEVYRRAADFDIIHFHVDYLHFPISCRMRIPNITTLHGRLDLPELPAVYRQFADMPVISISDSQRRPIPQANWLSTVYHGLPVNLFSLQEKPDDYLAFLGRVSPEKGLDRAIEVAIRVGMPLKIAAKVDKVDKEYFERKIKPMLDHPLIEYIGEIGEKEKQDFLGGARALLFMIDWPEPFGLVMIESMACGTPVVALRRGSVPEVLRHGVTGFIVDSPEEAVEAVRSIDIVPRAGCRNEFERRFTAARMASDYVDVYTQVQSREAPVLSITLQ
jgi:glycosyltransferase involved in cell wall biosynthesis